MSAPAETPFSRAELRAVLGGVFEDRLKLARAKSIRALFDDGDKSQRGFLVGEGDPIHLVVAGSLDLPVDAVIRDSIVGTIGLVHAVWPGAPAQPAVREWLDRAVYMRHLLIEGARIHPGERRQSYLVEAVLVLPPPVERDARQAISEELRQLMRETSMLHAIGVNIWQAETREEFTGAPAVFRAFPWLLSATREWLRSKRADAKDARAVRSIGLHNFRLAGPRTAALSPERRLHVIHGYNGSGKTSFAEAIEFRMTGAVQRIKEDSSVRDPDQTAHWKIFTHRGTSDASVTIGFGDGQTDVASSGEPFAPLVLHAGGFAFHQRLADRLVQIGPVASARTFLESFFSTDHRERIQAWSSARKAALAALAPLPAEMRTRFISGGEIDTGAILRELGWIEGPEIPCDRVAALLPFTLDEALPLAPVLNPALIETMKGARSLAREQFEKQLETLEAACAERFATALTDAETLRKVLGLLENLNSVSFTTGSASGTPLPQLLNEWLESVALNDLLQREQTIAQTLAAAASLGHHAFPGELPLLAEKGALAKIGARREQHDFPDRCERLREQLKNLTTAAEAARKQPSTTPGTGSLDFTLLDRAAAMGAFGEEMKNAGTALSHGLERAFRTQTVVEVRAGSQAIRIGEPGWTRELASRLQRVSSAFTSLAPRMQDAPTPRTRLAQFDALLAAARQGGEQNSKVVSAFIAELRGPLAAATNELTALFTPARWTYGDLAPKPVFDAGTEQLEFQSDDEAIARLRLNTAEMNSFALALFLLCAPSVPNPLRLLVLDDPLQNMDEFTVTAVARGIARLLRLWAEKSETDEREAGPPWQILMLLHSGEDLDRLRAEAPCAIYSLPWLTASAVGAGDGKLESEPIFIEEKMQELATLIVPRTPPATRTAARPPRVAPPQQKTP